MGKGLEDRLRFLEEENQKLKELLDIVFLISSAKGLDETLDVIMEKAKVIMEAEASSLMLIDRETNELVFHVVRGEKGDIIKGLRLKIGEGIAGWVAQTGESQIINDVQNHPRFYNKVDQKTNFKTRNMLCVPLRTRREIIGTVQVLNKKEGRDFTREDLRLFEVLAQHAAVAIENTRLREQATLDSLTKLYTRRYMDIILKDEFLRAKHNNEPLSFALFDIDHFKKVNDTYGHQVGDEVLKTVASVIKKYAREHDTPARYGGEEFALIMPNTSIDVAYEFIDDIREYIASMKTMSSEVDIMVTVSVGISCYPENRGIASVHDLIRYADISLYEAKNSGRNRVIVYK